MDETLKNLQALVKEATKNTKDARIASDNVAAEAYAAADAYDAVGYVEQIARENLANYIKSMEQDNG